MGNEGAWPLGEFAWANCVFRHPAAGEKSKRDRRFTSPFLRLEPIQVTAKAGEESTKAKSSHGNRSMMRCGM